MIPPNLVAGTTLGFTETVPDYPASGTSAFFYALVMPDRHLLLKSEPEGDAYKFHVLPSHTQHWQPGIYTWQSYIDSGDDRYLINSGALEVKPGFNQQFDGFDARSHVKKVLDAIESVIERRATKDQMGYTIEGRTLERTPIPDLLKFRDQYKIEYGREQQIEKTGVSAGRRRRVGVRFISS